MYTLKSIARRGSMLGAAFAVLAAAVVPAIPAYADALNPLTERSLTLSSSSPGWAYTDGSGNSTYAPPNSGANGQKTGNYFDFKVSSTATVKTMSFQYCTTSAGDCLIPGNNSTRGPAGDTDSTSDLHVEYPSAAEISGSSSAGTGTVTVTSGSKAVTGTGTSFLSAFKPGSSFKTAGGTTYQIASIASNTALTLTANAGATETGVAFSTSDFGTVVDPATGAVKAVPGYTNNNPKYQSQGGTGDPAEAAKTVAGNFIVMHKSGGVWVQSTGWTATAHKVNALADTGDSNNYIVVTNSTGQALTSGDQVKVLFFARTANYITNPGQGAFFVKINTYNQAFDNTSPSAPDVDLTGLAPATDANIIDGGVTVANVMNQSIQITTKVLETMEFSVGTVDPDTLTTAEIAASDTSGGNHKPCNRILTRFTSTGDPQRNVLQLGNQSAESSLETEKAYATHSYWRLSSNSSGGATVYYSGHTLSNTSGDEIAPIGVDAKHSAPGSEQFGLAIATTALSGTTAGTNDSTPSFNSGNYGVNYGQDRQVNKLWENAADNGKTAISSDLLTTIGATQGTPSATWTASDATWNYANLNKSYHTPRLDPLVPLTNYSGGTGTINGADSLDIGTNDELSAGDTAAAFAFDPQSDTVPRAIASESSQVVDCVTAKMRYVANIAATTPAGIYTTKINYIAAPQY